MRAYSKEYMECIEYIHMAMDLVVHGWTNQVGVSYQLKILQQGFILLDNCRNS